MKKIPCIFYKILAFTCAFTFNPEILSTRTVGMELKTPEEKFADSSEKVKLIIGNNAESIYDAITSLDIAILQQCGFKYVSSVWPNSNKHSPEAQKLIYDTEKGDRTGPLDGVWKFANSATSVMDYIHAVSKRSGFTLEEVLWYLYSNKNDSNDYELLLSELYHDYDKKISLVIDPFYARFMAW